jgi:hypothetical protein
MSKKAHAGANKTVELSPYLVFGFFVQRVYQGAKRFP